jgi:hypothetical protein
VADWDKAYAIEPVYAEVHMSETEEVSKEKKEVTLAICEHGVGQEICKRRGLLIKMYMNCSGCY